MASRYRTAATNANNQENVANIKAKDNAPQPTRRAALGEIGNKANITQIVAANNKAKNWNKPLGKSAVETGVNKIVEKTSTQALKPILKKKTQAATKSEPIVEIKVQQPEAFSSDLLSVEDIDEADKYNPALVSEYSNDIYNYLNSLEKKYAISKGFLDGQQVTPKMRSILIDWLVEVHQQFHLLQETLYLTTAIIDRFLQRDKTITKKRLQLVGVTAMFIACKYEEMYSPDIADFVYITDNAYVKTEILQMEAVILKTIDFSLGRPLPLHFLRRYSKAARALPLHHTMAKYFLEQSLLHYEFCHYPPSKIAAAAMYLSLWVIGHEDTEDGLVIWTNTLVHYTKYTKDDLFPIVHEIAKGIVNAGNSKYQAVRKKYTLAKHMKISLRPELKSPSILALVNVAKKE